MGTNDQTAGSINGSPIVSQFSGGSTGDKQVVTADGRLWTQLRGGVPTSLPTGAVVASIILPIIIFLLITPSLSAQQVEWRPAPRPQPTAPTPPSQSNPDHTQTPLYIATMRPTVPTKTRYKSSAAIAARQAAQKEKNLLLIRYRQSLLIKQYNASRLRATTSGSYRFCVGGKCSR